MKAISLTPIRQAKKIIKEGLKDIPLHREEIPIMMTCDRVLAGDIYAPLHVPHFDKATVDGYAITQGDAQNERDMLRLVGRVEIGQKPPGPLEEGTCVYVPTGAALPVNTYGMVMIEDTSSKEDTLIQINHYQEAHKHVIRKGQDIALGQLVLKEGTPLSPKEVGLLAAIGVEKVLVYRQPRIGFLSSGDELVRDPKELTDNKIMDINSYTLSMLARQAGAEVVFTEIIKDHYEYFKSKVQKRLEEVDILVVSGGSSVGIKDYTKRIFNEIGSPGVFLHGLNVKPGKPTIFGRHHDKILIGLPGHPVSAMTIFTSFVVPVMEEVYKCKGIHFPEVQARLAEAIYPNMEKETHVMVRLEETSTGYVAHKLSGKSGMISMIAYAHGKVVIPEFTHGYQKDQLVQVKLFNNIYRGGI